MRSLTSRAGGLGLIPTLALLLLLPASAGAERIKDLANIRGVRDNKLIGYGLVVGLAGTGDTDKTRFTYQSVLSFLKRAGIRVDARGLKLKNVAAVTLTATLPPYARAGTKLDVTVSSLGDSKSLTGGVLLASPLKAADGHTYALAQGPVTVGGFSVGGRGGGEVKNHPTVGRVPHGAMVEREFAVDAFKDSKLTLQLNEADWTTAARLRKTIDQNLGGDFAKALDSRTVEVKVPPAYAKQPVELVALIERLQVNPDGIAKVVINERTGTVIIGQDVRVAPVAVAHGNLTVSVRAQERVVPAAPFTAGESQTEKNATLDVEEEDRRLMAVKRGADLASVVQGLNELGASPRDLITILQAIKQAGALPAVLEVQ